MKRAWILFFLFTGSLMLEACRPAAARVNDQASTNLPQQAIAQEASQSPAASPTSLFLTTPTAIFTPTSLPSRTPTATTAPLATPTASPLACWSSGGRLEVDSLSSAKLKLPMEYLVYLPPCYDQQPERRYPVLYLIHGQNYSQDQWDRLGADETADRLIAAGEIHPFLIVMPRDRSWSQPAEDPFGQVLAEELLPLIDRQYRTLPDRAHRAVGGLSRGAGWAVHLGLSHWELFGAVGAHSLPIFWGDTPFVRGWLAAIPPESMPRIFIDIGDKDRPNILTSARWFEKLLTDKNIPHEWYLFPGYHEEAYWSAHVEKYLRWYARDW